MKNYKLFIIFWLMYLAYGIATDYLSEPHIVFVDEIIIFFTNNIFIFYSSLWCFQKSNFSKIDQSLKSICRFIFFIFLYYSMRFLYKNYLQGYLNSPFAGVNDFKEFLITGSLWYIQFTLLAIGYYFIGKSKKLQVENRELEYNKVIFEAKYKELKAEKIKTEYNYLRTQINPHFLYNTLNVFYGQTVGTQPNTAQGILLLTEIMRYSLNTGSEADNRVPLNDEIEQLHNYIQLQQLRFNNQLQINTTITGNTDGVKILPHIFLTFAENAIKHGDTNDTFNPVKITIDVTNNILTYKVNNKMSRSKKDAPGTGLGIKNAVNRMQLQYGNALKFEQKSCNDFFTIQIKLDVAQDAVLHAANQPILTNTKKHIA